MNARVDEQPAWLPPLVLTIVGAVLIRVGQALRRVDDNLADLGD